MSRLRIPVSAADQHDGPLDAPVVLVEYGDYECPYCGTAAPELKAVKAAFGDRLCFVFRNFPLTEAHPHALHAAEFAMIAAGQGKFWQAHDMLYDHQSALRDENLADYAARLGIDLRQARGSEGTILAAIQDEFSGGVRSGVNGTPCLFLNGTRFDGPAEAGALIQVITEILQGS